MLLSEMSRRMDFALNASTFEAFGLRADAPWAESRGGCNCFVKLQLALWGRTRMLLQLDPVAAVAFDALCVLVLITGGLIAMCVYRRQRNRTRPFDPGAS